MSCTDDNAGHHWCSMEVAHCLAYYGFGRTLLDATISFQFVEFMNFVAKWCINVCKVLKTDPQSLLGGRHHELACIIEEEHIKFPDPAILAMYLLPLTSWSDGCSPVTVMTSCQPDLQSVAAFCLQHLSWLPAAVQSKLMDVHASVVVHALLQAIWKVHPVFHTLQVYPYMETDEYGPAPPPPIPDVVDDEVEWELEAILNHQAKGEHKECKYLVKQKGFPHSSNTWEPEVHIKEHAEEALYNYKLAHCLNI
ncbi:hypothetical protein F5141DRAFT_1221959 [Pisolithus sp. B1]|nr:hypothetical protein F5141DRAFT_1221959 [Pisolithus sp. B1]